jgi:DNA-directed RNA polymerase subunit M/transcription elongation factor TFIIS
MSGGLGLSEFLSHGDSGSRKFFAWKKEGKATVWLSTRAAIAYASWSHPFNEIRVVEDEKTGEEKETLRFVRFASPDAEVVSQNQYFRLDDGSDRLQVPAIKDPFILLREWLRLEAEHVPLDAVIFEWENPKTGERIQWRRKHLAKIADTDRQTWSHTLDSKLEYLFVVCNDDRPEDGLQIVRGTKLLGEQIRDEIKKQIASNGDEEGNPQHTPYAFRWIFDKSAKKFNETYRAFRFNKAKLTQEIERVITDSDFPDPSPDCRSRPGDKARIRAAMEAAARIDLPWDRLFVPQWVDDEVPSEKKPRKTRAPDVATDFSDDPKPSEKQASKPQANGPAPRRRKKKEPEPPPEPERIPCDDCGHMLLPTDRKCPKCGAEYEIDDEPEEVAPPTEKVSEKVSEKREKATQSKAAQSKSASSADKCFACGADEVVDDRCQNCGMVVDDDIPF